MSKITKIKGKEFIEVQKIAGEIEGIVQHPEHVYKIMADHFADTFFVARDDSPKNEIVGFMLGFISQTIHNHLFIWQIAVSEKVQGKGIGSKLLQFTIDNCKKTDACSAVVATVETTNKASQNLFESFDFKITSKKFAAPYQEIIKQDGKEAVENYYNSGTDQIFYLLEL